MDCSPFADVFRHARLLAGLFLLLTMSVRAAAQDMSGGNSRVSATLPSVGLAAVDSAVHREMERQQIPGVALALLHGDKVLAAKGYGFANLEHRVPVTAETMFQSGSLGKMFTAAGIMALVEEGKLDLDESVRTYLPDAPAAWQPITLRHLLSHTSGIPDYTGDQMDYRKDYTEDALLEMAYGLPLEFTPGQRWNYSNTGYVVLGIVIHKATGKPYWEFLRERIFGPANLPTIRVIREAEVVPHRAAGYLLRKGEWQHQEWVSPTLNTTADGSLLLSLHDMIAWNEAVRTRSVLRPESWKLMQSPVRLNSGNVYPYGFGWFVDSLRGRVVHQHGGSWQGFRTQFTRYPDDDVGIVVLTNLGSADPVAVANAVAAAVSPELAPEPLPTEPIEDPDPAATAYVRGILEKTARGMLSLEDFAFVRQTTFPRLKVGYADLLRGLGAPERLDLLAREEVGDDRHLTYRATYGERAFIVTATLATDGRLAGLAIRPSAR